MEAGKDLVPLLLSALALGSLLLWNFLIGRLAYWTGAEQYSSLGIAFVVAWHVALALSLLSLSLLGWRLNSLRGVWIVCAVMAVLDAVLCGMRLGDRRLPLAGTGRRVVAYRHSLWDRLRLLDCLLWRLVRPLAA